MAEPKSNELMEKIVSLCKRKGFIFQSSEIYGGINGFWDYGPLGAELKRNVKELWWNTMTRFRDDVVGLEATIIMHPQIWRASGHVDTFADMMRECPLTNKRVRADQVDPQSGNAIRFSGGLQRTAKPSSSAYGRLRDMVEEHAPKIFCESDLLIVIATLKEGLNVEDAARIVDDDNFKRLWKPFSVLLPPGKPSESARKLAIEFYAKNGIANPILLGERADKVENSIDFHPETGVELSEARAFNLMFKTYVGPVAPMDNAPQEWAEFNAMLDEPLLRAMWHANLIESQKNVAYLRPETAQAIFAQFKNVLETSRQMPPFGIGQIGKAFRNEVTPRNFTFRSREFEQMELEFFIKPDEAVEALYGSVATVPATGHPGDPQPNWGWQAWHQYWVEERVRFYEGIGLLRDTLGFHRQTKEELAHYARACVDILFKFPFSKVDGHGHVEGDELEGIAARGDFDLSQHEKFSGKPLTIFEEELRGAWAKLSEERKSEMRKDFIKAKIEVFIEKKKMSLEEASEAAGKEAQVFFEGLAKGQYIPHVIEPSAGVDRLILALISNAYHEETVTDEKGKAETRIVMKFHPRVAPIKVGVFPLLKNKPDLVKKAQEVRDLLRPHLTVFYDEAGAIGRRYRRQDEAGTPFGVTIDFDTLGEKPELLNTVTLRERDSMRQERVPLDKLLPLLLEKIR
jgi:glycyl-tRNA synthetase